MFDLLRYPDWAVEGQDWPHSSHSQFIDAGAYRWHVQRIGAGPSIILLHGAGAATHSWARLIEYLHTDYELIALDLPGHGFTERVRVAPVSPRAYADAIDMLIPKLAIEPQYFIGHSAGAAIMMDYAARRPSACRALVSINGALMPFAGPAGFFFPVFARMIHFNPMAPHVFAASASRHDRVERLIKQTGSKISSDALGYYRRLLACSGHVSGVLRMMANWDLSDAENRLKKIETPTLFLAGDGDRAVPPSDSENAAATMRQAEYRLMQGYGHLLHEEAPSLVAEQIGKFFNSVTNGKEGRAG